MDIKNLLRAIFIDYRFAMISVVYFGCLFLVPPIFQVFGVVFFTLLLFTTEKLPVDITAILVMSVLMVLGLVSPEQGVSGFSNPATITVMCMFILSGSIARTGAIHKLGHYVFKFAKKSLTLQITLIAGIVAPISGLFNNTAAVAIFLPMIMTLSKASKTPATKLLIPLSFLSMLGGTLTLVGTSTNILANSILEDSGMEGFSMFSFTKIGLIVLAVGVIYFVLVGRFILPDRKNEETEGQDATKFLAEIEIRAGSKLIGQLVSKINIFQGQDIEIIKIIRGNRSYVKDVGKVEIAANDIVVFNADEQKIIDLNGREFEKILVDFDEDRRKLAAGTGRIIRIVVPNIFHKKTLGDVNFWKKFSAGVIGLHRTELSTKRIGDMVLKRGEILLVRVTNSNYYRIRNSKDIVVLEEVEQEFDSSKTVKAVSVLALVVGLAAFNILPIMVSAILGVLLMFLTKCLRPREIYQTVSWDVIFLLAGLIPLGIAMTESGAADLIANSIVGVSYHLSPLLIFGVFYLVTTLITEVISNNAAVVLLVPIAIAVAQKLGINPISLTLIVMFAASTSFLTPVGYQTNTMVYGAGNYKFTDFIKVGLPLNIILLVVTSLSVYYFFGV